MTTVIVVASNEGHAIAVVADMAAAYQAAANDAHLYSEGETLVWTIETSEAATQWTQLHARTASGASIGDYVLTELESAAADGTFTQPAPRSKPVSPEPAAAEPAQAPDTPPPADTADNPPPPAAEPPAAPQPPETSESAEPADMPECVGKYEGCAGHVENSQQVHLSTFKQQAPLCSNCYRHEVANGIPPRLPA